MTFQELWVLVRLTGVLLRKVTGLCLLSHWTVDFHAKLTLRGLVGHFCVEINMVRRCASRHQLSSCLLGPRPVFTHAQIGAWPIRFLRRCRARASRLDGRAAFLSFLSYLCFEFDDFVL